MGLLWGGGGIFSFYVESRAFIGNIMSCYKLDQHVFYTKLQRIKEKDFENGVNKIINYKLLLKL